MRVIDRFGLGGTSVRVCARRCRPLRFAPAVTVRSVTLAVGERVTVRTRYGTTSRRISPRGETPPVPSVLATGDSTMTGVESFLADELGDDADVISGVLPGGRLSGEENGWLRVAREQVARDRPDLVVLSIGANEGFSVDGRQCCYPAWVNAYAKRMRAVLRIYRQGGRAQVLVATIQLPRFPERVPVTVATNEGIRRAAGDQVIALDEVFTPDGYRETMPYRGRRVRVRASDGIHLNASGQAIAARLIAAALAPLIRR